MSEFEKLKLIKDLIDFINYESYDPEGLSKFAYIKSLDEKVHRYNDSELNKIFDDIGGMSAGEEFHFTKEELLEILNSYIKNMK